MVNVVNQFVNKLVIHTLIVSKLTLVPTRWKYSMPYHEIIKYLNLKRCRRNIAFLSISLVSATGCSNVSDIPLEKPSFSQSSEAERLISASWDKILDHCPGLSLYRNDLSYVRVDNFITPEFKDMSRAEVVYRVSDNPSEIPSVMMSQGHHCGFGVFSDGSYMIIQKDVCVSVCLGKKYSGPTGYFSNW